MSTVVGEEALAGTRPVWASGVSHPTVAWDGGRVVCCWECNGEQCRWGK